MIKSGEVSGAIAIEPEPNNFYLLEHNVEQNDLKNKVVCINVALSEVDSEVEFELNENNYGDHRVRHENQVSANDSYAESEREVISVQARQLDKLLKEVPAEVTNNISVIWIDVQGFEGYVFKGGAKLFEKNIPVVTEIWPYGIERSGFSKAEFCALVKEVWSYYWVLQNNNFIRHDIDDFETYYEKFEGTKKYANVILSHK